MHWTRALGAAGLACVGVARPAVAQAWDDARALALVRRATEQRVVQLADSGLTDYRATAHGYLTFLAQLGEGFLEVPRVVKADELALQVYWRAPNLSKQRIVGRRDTTLLPTDIQYHRDHLGIVQNNFPAIIRLGEGDEVRDVPHPLSVAGGQLYQFALTDSLRITIPGRVIDVYELRVRPRDETRPAVVGAVYLDRESARVVRMAFNFTRASFLDRQLEDVSIVLENGLIGTRFWLPRRQEIEIRRSLTWLDFPMRGIIRGRWEIGGYEVNVGVPAAQFVGPEIVAAPPAEIRQYPWPATRLVDSLPADARVATPAEVRRVQQEARVLVREQALRRARRFAFAAQDASDFVRFNRVEGLAVGAGVRARVGAGWSLEGSGRWGEADRRAKGRLALVHEDPAAATLTIFAQQDHRDLGDVPERSTLVNSLAAQEFGSDFTDPYRVASVGLTLTRPVSGGAVTVAAASERHQPVRIAARPFSGRFLDLVPVDVAKARVLTVALEQSGSVRSDVEYRARGEANVRQYLGVSRSDWTNVVVRVAGDLEITGILDGSRVVSRTLVAVKARDDSGGERLQDYVFLGGPVSGPGHGYHSLWGDAALAQRLEFRVPVPFARLPLGRFGRSPGIVTLAPFVSVAALFGPRPPIVLYSSASAGSVVLRDSLPPEPGLYPSAGTGLIALYDLVRIDVARAWRPRSLSPSPVGTKPLSGEWVVYLDVHRAFWRLL